MTFPYALRRDGSGVTSSLLTNARKPVPAPNLIPTAFGTALLGLLPLILFYLCVSIAEVDVEALNFVNALAPFYFMAVMFFLIYRLLRIHPDAIWTPAVWFPIQSAVFYGVGPLVEVHGNEATLRVLRGSLLAITPEELLRVNLLSMIGIFSVMFGFWVHGIWKSKGWFSAQTGDASVAPAAVRPEIIAVSFVAAGAILNYFLIWPSQWGMIDIVVPGVLSTLSPLIDVGFALVAFLATRGNRFMLLLFLLLWPVNLFVSTLTFSKTAILKGMLLPAIGAYFGNRRLWQLGLAVVVTAFVFMMSQPFVSYGRAIIQSETGTIWHADYTRRFELVKNYIFDERKTDSFENEEIQSWWIRLDFAGVQAFAMNRYDRGVVENNLTNIWLHFVPRIIWPDKPIIDNPGQELTGFITGDEDLGFTGLSIYADAYWQFGWLGVVIASTLVGLLFAMMTIHSLRVLSARDFFLIPIVLVGMQTAAQVPNQFLISVIGLIPTYFVLLWGLKFLASLLRSLNGRSRAIAN